MKMNKLILLVLFISLYISTSAQTINKGDFAINTSVDNVLGRYNIGGEYFFAKSKNDSLKIKSVFSVFANVGITKMHVKSALLTGTSINTEL